MFFKSRLLPMGQKASIGGKGLTRPSCDDNDGIEHLTDPPIVTVRVWMMYLRANRHLQNFSLPLCSANVSRLFVCLFGVLRRF